MTTQNIITIDGTLHSGRTTLANNLVKTYGFKHLNLETVLRRIASIARARKTKIEDTPGILKIAEALRTDHLLNPDRNKELRSEGIVGEAQRLFAIPELPDVLNARFKALAGTQPGLVAVGTAMARNVFPDAPLQFFLTADRKERQRRMAHQAKKPGLNDAMQAYFERTEINMLVLANLSGWKVGPSGYGYKEAPVHQPQDLELASALQQIYIDTSSLGSGRLSEMANQMMQQRLPQVERVEKAKVMALTAQI